MNSKFLSIEQGRQPLRASAFDLWPEAALILDDAGVLIAVNEAAEQLFGAGLPALARGPMQMALPTESGLNEVINRATAKQLAVRVRDLEVAFLGRPGFTADVAATPLPQGGILLTFHVRPASVGVERGGDAGGLP